MVQLLKTTLPHGDGSILDEVDIVLVDDDLDCVDGGRRWLLPPLLIFILFTTLKGWFLRIFLRGGPIA